MKHDVLMQRDGCEPAPPPETASAARHDVEFVSGGVSCRAWLYEPLVNARRPATPCIVMAHGLGGTRACALDPYARAFVAAGFHVLLFDYRCLGDSDGLPRQVVSIPGQLEDWAAAIRFARALPGVDPARIGLWGTSLSGGHVITMAARDPEIAAISAQCPMVDGRASVYMIVRELGWGRVLRLGLAGLFDWARTLLGLSPYCVPLVAPPGGLAAMASHDAYDGMHAIVSPTWRNEIAARVFLSLRWYRPRRAAKSVKCPALIIACQKDSVTSPNAAVEAARSMRGKARLVELPIGHFDIYLGEWFERSSAEQIAFFKQALGA